MTTKFTIWNDIDWNRISPELREETLARHNFVQNADALPHAEIILGRPDPTVLQEAEKLRWIHLTSAGHAPYDGATVTSLLKQQSITLTNSSAVYAEPCAQHLLAMMLSLSRSLPAALDEQRGARQWNQTPLRRQSNLLQQQKVLLLSFGAIARRLVEMMAPFHLEIFALRRHLHEEENVTMITSEQLPKVLLEMDHIVNILPENDSTHHFVDAIFLSHLKPEARFYNIGRGSTVDQTALLAALRENRLAAAYLDVTTPEPLPPDHPLWDEPHCYITPHSGGGHRDELDRLLRHFLHNLALFEKGAPLTGRVY